MYICKSVQLHVTTQKLLGVYVHCNSFLPVFVIERTQRTLDATLKILCIPEQLNVTMFMTMWMFAEMPSNTIKPRLCELSLLTHVGYGRQLGFTVDTIVRFFLFVKAAPTLIYLTHGFVVYLWFKCSFYFYYYYKDLCLPI